MVSAQGRGCAWEGARAAVSVFQLAMYPLLLAVLCLLVPGTALPRHGLYPYGLPRGDTLLPGGDDETSDPVTLTQPLLFFEAQFNQLYVGTNGIISPQDFPRETQYVDDGFPTDFPVIAPFLSDIDTSNGRGKIYYRQDVSDEIVNMAAGHIQRGFPEAAFTPTNVFLVTWENVGAYEEVTRHSASSNRLNTFQAVLAYDESDAYAVFIYPEDGLQFFGTRPKESYNVNLELPARVGFSRGESETVKREAPFYSLTTSEQSVKNLYQSSNVGIPGVWVFHIGSISELDNVIPAKFGDVSVRGTHTGPTKTLLHEEDDIEDADEYSEPFYEDNGDDLEYPTSETTEMEPIDAYTDRNLNTGSRGVLDIDDPNSHTSHSDIEPSLRYTPVDESLSPREPVNPYQPNESEDIDVPLGEPEIQPGERWSETDDDSSYNKNLSVYPETVAPPSNTEILTGYPESEVVSRGDQLPDRDYRRNPITEDVGLDTDVFAYIPVNRETCNQKRGLCSHHSVCTDYVTGSCCHCQESYYGNGLHCLPKGAPHRVNGKVSGNILVGQTALSFEGADLHAYAVVNDGRAYTAISQVPEPASWSLAPLIPIGGLFGWLFALEKPGYQNGFSITGAKFVHNIEIVFYPGQEAVYITQTADGFDSENYINLKTKIQGKIPYIPQTSTIQIPQYTELYHYSGSVVTSNAVREYTVTSESNEVQKFSYRLRQNVSYYDCEHAQRFPPNAQKLSVDRVFALYNKDEKVVRYAITNHVGSVHDSPGEESQEVNPCYDGTHICDTRAQCQPASGLNYSCVCASGFHGDGHECADLNECEMGLSKCGQNTVCVNLEGSYKCDCQSGYSFSAVGQSCELTPAPVNPCEDGTHTCEKSSSRCVHRGDGVFACECFPGFFKIGERCIAESSISCSERRRLLLEERGLRGLRPLLGSFVPDCDDQGNYSPLQCHGSTGYCWCVNERGEEREGTKTAPGRPQPQCQTPPEKTTPCLVERRRLLEEQRSRGARPALGSFVPDCDEEGNYSPLQCHGSTGYCWCVNERGEEREGTKTPPGRPQPQCQTPEENTTPCLAERRRLLEEQRPRGPRPVLGGFIPECDEEGNYSPLQCHRSTGYCWCVDRNGEEISGSRTQPGTSPPQCNIPVPTQRPQSVCERWKQSLLEHYGGKPTDQQYVPQCDAYGDFSPLQCHGNSGYCWCVDKNGQELPGSRTQPGMTPACIPSVAPPTMRPTPRPDVGVATTGTYLLYAQGQQIGYLPLNGAKLNKENARTLLSLHGSIVVGIDYDCQEKKVYWTDVAGRTINRAGLEPGAEPEIIISTGLMSTEGLAIDYLRRTMFWTDSGLDKIESSRLDGSDRKVLFDTQLVNPRAITVDPVRGNLYWTDWNREAPKIETSFVDGSNRRILVNDDIGLPNGLTFDPLTKQICWSDAGTKKLECILSNGTGRREIQSNLNYPFSVVAYANHFYHTDWRRDGVISINQENGQITDEYLPEQRSHLYGITAVYPYCPTGRK
ncbi:nidogen-2 [Pelobates fuscus]|uniref:nidogen-2 n=1 Tax=Pelobates fuscus TaxID=191477 RepID=UPI002FE49F9D